jgi:[acyl-carrier-protein] S-malonyltransferase
MTLALLCSGQGWQRAGMFMLTGDVPEAVGLFAQATALLGGHDPRELVRTQSSDVLHKNRMGQILCALQALAAATALEADIPNRPIVAGYSIGEMAAWGVAGFLSMTDTLELVAKRAEAMDAVASRGEGMSFVRGLGRDEIDELCRRYDTEIAIIEPGDAFVLGGQCARLRALVDEARAMGATRMVELPVEVPSHTSLLADATVEFRSSLGRVAAWGIKYSRARLLSGIDGAPVSQIEAGLDKLAAQISQSVHWEKCLKGCIEAGATVFLELGPGHALSDMMAGAYPAIPTRALDDFKTLEGVRAWLARHLAA